MKISHEPAVLIAGAGSTGLMLACQLAMRGTSFRIIDQRSELDPDDTTIILQARTLEIFGQMGLDRQLLEDGQKTTGLNFLVQGRWVQHFNFQAIGRKLSPYPFFYRVKQSRIKQLLLDFLGQYGLEVEWNTRFIHVEQSGEAVKVLLQKDHINIPASFSWLVGADGADSQVRKLNQIPSTSRTTTQVYAVAEDSEVVWDLNPEEAFICLTKSKTAAFLPIPGSSRFQVISSLQEKAGQENGLNAASFARDLENHLNIPFYFQQLSGLAFFQPGYHYAHQMRKGRCLLAGSAAHHHNHPTSHGINKGIQDAENLAWKLALVTRECAPQTLLDTFQQERRPVAQKWIQAQNRAMGYLASNNPVCQYTRLQVLPWLLKKIFRYNWLRKKIFNWLMQTGTSYRKSALSHAAPETNHFPAHAPHPGDRVPFVSVFSIEKNCCLNLYELLDQPYFTLLLFKSTFSTDRAENLAAALQEALLPVIPDMLEVVIIYPHELNEEAYQDFGVNEDAFYLIRPDNFIAFRSQPADVHALLEYLYGHLGLNQGEPVPEHLLALFDPAYD